MKPALIINFNETFENAAFVEELSNIMFGAELGLKYSNASETAADEVKRNIIRSAFASFSIDYDGMASAPETTVPKPAEPYEAPDSAKDFSYLPDQPEQAADGGAAALVLDEPAAQGNEVPYDFDCDLDSTNNEPVDYEYIDTNGDIGSGV